MRVLVDDRFREEIAAHALRFTCRDCLYYVAPGCAHEWPNQDHEDPPAPGQATFLFCKEFELR